MIHHRTWFPLIVIGLTIALGVTIYALFKDRATTIVTSPITEQEYELQVQHLVSTLPHDLSLAASDSDRVALLTKKRDALLDVTVPGNDKDVHLEMVMTLTQWIAGFAAGDGGKQAAAESRWQALTSQYPWIGE